MNRAQRRAALKKPNKSSYRWITLPKPMDEFCVFQMPRTILEKIENGEIETIEEIPQVLNGDSGYIDASPVLAGWVYTWQLISEELKLGLNLSALQLIARKLYKDELINHTELKEAKAALESCSPAFRSIDRQEIVRIANIANDNINKGVIK